MTLEYNNHFPPQPSSNFNRDDLLQWLAEQTISAQKLITGSLQADQEISSSNFASGSAGWQIDGDGNAEFNDVTVRGDLVSGNWDGTDPPNLSSKDSGATAGFALDSSQGAAQFEGNIWIGGNVTVDGKIQTADTGQRTVMEDLGGLGGISFYGAAGDDPGFIYAINSEEMQIAAPVDDDSTHDFAMIRLQSENNLGFTASMSVAREGASGNQYWLNVDGDGIEVRQGSVSHPGYTFIGDTDTGFYRPTADQVSVAGNGEEIVRFVRRSDGGQQVRGVDGSQGKPTYSFLTDIDTGMYLNSAAVALTAGGTRVARFANGSIHMYGRNTTTDSGLSAWRNNGFPGSELLALSSSREDKKDIKDANPKKYLNRLDALRPREYKSKAGADDGRRKYLGIVKEEAEEVWPRWTYEAMNVPFLIAIQDLRKRVAELEAA